MKCYRATNQPLLNSMIKLDVIKAGMYTTIQDAGRSGMMFYGVPISGYMDGVSARYANALVGNRLDLALMEMTYQGGTFRFNGHAKIALTGADLRWQIDDLLAPLNRCIEIKPGQVLNGTYTQAGLRGYLAINGVMQHINTHFNSSATYEYARFGGLDGRALLNGDEIVIDPGQPSDFNHDFRPILTPLDCKIICCLPGPDYQSLSKESKKKLKDISFRIGHDSNRMGARLEAESKLYMNEAYVQQSNPLLPGTIQLLPSGQLITVLQDGQTTGGYPRILYIPPIDLDAFNQIRPGRNFRLKIDELLKKKRPAI